MGGVSGKIPRKMQSQDPKLDNSINKYFFKITIFSRVPEDLEIYSAHPDGKAVHTLWKVGARIMVAATVGMPVLSNQLTLPLNSHARKRKLGGFCIINP